MKVMKSEDGAEGMGQRDAVKEVRVKGGSVLSSKVEDGKEQMEG